MRHGCEGCSWTGIHQHVDVISFDLTDFDEVNHGIFNNQTWHLPNLAMVPVGRALQTQMGHLVDRLEFVPTVRY